MKKALVILLGLLMAVNMFACNSDKHKHKDDKDDKNESSLVDENDTNDKEPEKEDEFIYEGEIGKINNEYIPKGVFINCFFYEIEKSSQSDNWSEEYNNLFGNDLYNALKDNKVENKSLLQHMIENALEETRLFMIEYQVFSAKEGWPEESEIQKIKEDAESYLEQMFLYYGASFNVDSVEKFVEESYCMKYEDLIEYFVMSGCINQYKESLVNKIQFSKQEVNDYFEENKKKYNTVEVMHSLLMFPENAKENDKAELLEEAQSLVDKYNAGEITFDDIMKRTEDVDENNKPNNNGCYTVYDGAGFVAAFEEWGVKQTEASDKIEIVETEYGYHIMKCIGVYDMTNETLYQRVEDEFLTQKVDSVIESEIEKNKGDNNFNITNINEEYLQKIAKSAITGEI